MPLFSPLSPYLQSLQYTGGVHLLNLSIEREAFTAEKKNTMYLTIPPPKKKKKKVKLSRRPAADAIIVGLEQLQVAEELSGGKTAAMHKIQTSNNSGSR